MNPKLIVIFCSFRSIFCSRRGTRKYLQMTQPACFGGSLVLHLLDNPTSPRGICNSRVVCAADQLPLFPYNGGMFIYPIVGFIYPIVGFIYPTVGFIYPIVGFIYPLVGFIYPIVGFIYPTVGFIIYPIVGPLCIPNINWFLIEWWNGQSPKKAAFDLTNDEWKHIEIHIQIAKAVDKVKSKLIDPVYLVYMHGYTTLVA